VRWLWLDWHWLETGQCYGQASIENCLNCKTEEQWELGFPQVLNVNSQFDITGHHAVGRCKRLTVTRVPIWAFSALPRAKAEREFSGILSSVVCTTNHLENSKIMPTWCIFVINYICVRSWSYLVFSNHLFISLHLVILTHLVWQIVMYSVVSCWFFQRSQFLSYCLLLFVVVSILNYVFFKLLNWIGFMQAEYLEQLTNHDVRYLLYKSCVSSSRCSWCLPVNSSADVLYPSVDNQSLCSRMTRAKASSVSAADIFSFLASVLKVDIHWP